MTHWRSQERLGHFLRKGMKPFPALDMRHHISPKYPCINWLSTVLFCLNKKMTKSGRACAGTGFMPFQKQCSTYFLKRLGHFLRKGMKPFPALDMRHPISPKYPCINWLSTVLFCLNKKMTKSGRACAGKGFMPFQKQCSTYFSRVCVICNNSLIL